MSISSVSSVGSTNSSKSYSELYTLEDYTRSLCAYHTILQQEALIGHKETKASINAPQSTKKKLSGIEALAEKKRLAKLQR